MFSPLGVSYSTFLILLSGPALSGLFVYLALYNLFIPEEISFPVAIIVFILTFGLVNYYYRFLIIKANEADAKPDITLKDYRENNNNNTNNSGATYRFLILAYFTSLLIVALGSDTSRELFLPWEQINPLQIIQLGAAITISFLIPGCAIIGILDVENSLGLLSKLLLAYLFSIFITGLISYITSSLGLDFSVTRLVLILIHACILSTFVILRYRTHHFGLEGKNILSFFYYPFLSRASIGNMSWRWITSLRNHYAETLVFSGILAFVILATYFVYGGTIVGDQWFHHGRALSFLSGTFRSAASLHENLDDPPFAPAFLAGFFSLSGTPSVNAYAAIDFLNIIPVLAFYYFFSSWVPRQKSKAALLASVLFMLSSGFGWAYLLFLANTNQVASEQGSLDSFNDARIKSFDIFQPSSFVVVENPNITSPLIIISLPAGLVLLGLIVEGRDFMGSNIRKISYVVIVTIVSLVGGLSHTEFYLFVLVSSVLVLIFGLGGRDFIFIAFVLSILLTILADVLPGQYFTAIKILGIPVTYLALAFTGLMWALSHLRNSIAALFYGKPPLKLTHFIRVVIMTRKFFGRSIRVPLMITLVSLIAYLYVFTFLVWGELSLEDVQLQTSRNGQQEVPWYLYPMKLGVCGLLGLLYVICYLFRPLEKKTIAFGILIAIALGTGPYYDEHRFSKYVMIGVVGFAAILVYDLLSTASLDREQKGIEGKKFSLIFTSITISLIVVSAGLSVVLYTGYGVLAMANHYPPFEKDSPKRHFPPLSEINLFKSLFNDISSNKKNYNIITSPDEYKIRQDGFVGKLEAFVGIPTTKLLRGQDVLKAISLERFYDLLNHTDSKYIILKIDDILSGRNYAETEQDRNGPNGSRSFEPARFAFENFHKVYQDSNYTVVSVPDNLVALTEEVDDTKSIDPFEEKSPDNENTPKKINDMIMLPGDLSERAKQKAVEVYWQKVMISPPSIFVAVLIPIAVVIIRTSILSLWRRKR
jgi:hypothetical protein